jgi:hypothetical protein
MTSDPSPQQGQPDSTPPADLPQSIAGLSDEQGQQVLNEITAGHKIQAIKLYRQFTNVGLKEAKDAVEEIESRLPGGRRAKSGCGSAVVLLAAGVAAVIYVTL